MRLHDYFAIDYNVLDQASNVKHSKHRDFDLLPFEPKCAKGRMWLSSSAGVRDGSRCA